MGDIIAWCCIGGNGDVEMRETVMQQRNGTITRARPRVAEGGGIHVLELKVEA